LALQPPRRVARRSAGVAERLGSARAAAVTAPKRPGKAFALHARKRLTAVARRAPCSTISVFNPAGSWSAKWLRVGACSAAARKLCCVHASLALPHAVAGVRRAASARLLCVVRDGQDRRRRHGAAGGVNSVPHGRGKHLRTHNIALRTRVCALNRNKLDHSRVAACYGRAARRRRDALCGRWC
jgi:hypothetical protein